jgi:hypothetical protein
LKSPLERGDFEQLAKTADPHIDKTGGLAGLIIEATAFPGWNSLGALAAHIRFVRDHHRRLASHFVSAEIKHFAEGEREAARQWITSRR